MCKMWKILTDNENEEYSKDNYKYFLHNVVVTTTLDVKLVIAEIIVFISYIIKVPVSINLSLQY